MILFSRFFCRFIFHSDPCFVHSPNFIGVTVWGNTGALDKKSFTKFLLVSRVLWFLKMTHQNLFKLFKFPCFLLSCLYSLKGNHCLDQFVSWLGRVSLWYSFKFFSLSWKRHMLLVLCTSFQNFIGCTVWGLGALDKKEIYQNFVGVICVLYYF